MDAVALANTPGQQKNPALLAVLAQAGRLYVNRTGRVAAYSGINGGWERTAFGHLTAPEFSEFLAAGLSGPSPDFSTNGGPIQFGFMFRHTTSYRYDTNGLVTSSRVDNFRVEVQTLR